MEVNKDEAERCIQIAIDALKSGNIERSEKFLRKADNLFPSQRAKGMINDCYTTPFLVTKYFENGKSLYNHRFTKPSA